MQKIVTETQQKQAVDALKRLVSKPSVHDDATVSETTPFGKGIDEALTEVLAIAKENGFTTYKDPNGNYGYAEIGSGDQTFGIIGHVDVVPTGDPNDWDHDPFDATIVDGHIYGRGTQDDKGPTMQPCSPLRHSSTKVTTSTKRSASFLVPMKKPSGET
ncbi:acetylornithine deacetylase/succinyl-diaminopimelate desuccinylase [Lentilactobacillus farraginis DSM 18382 = JCM 14108]|uniref:Acetylornithine deacetylase/succinyl-diaminopimelate desuccinylase n=1 Tax=Lentilactobacillus farraginis DSM 18382 = JCM 14108 TaxID=1423743 RepID=X0P9L3_9LACO|nr:acetylornithine deacetylase/succinyl-diaminopimelate desuccinylase [Lentilactobacillus farraginis DSM 18382 = JCM 14108]